MIDNMLFVFGEIEKYEMNGFAPHFWMCNPLDILQEENLLALSKAQDWHVDSPPMDQISLQRWCQMKVFYPKWLHVQLTLYRRNLTQKKKINDITKPNHKLKEQPFI